MRGGLERWKRGVDSQGVRQAMAYAFKGSCDSHLRSVTGVEALAAYSAAGTACVTRFTVRNGEIDTDGLSADELRDWVDGRDPRTGVVRGRELTSPQADLILDGTINAPKTYSIVALINADLSAEFEALQDRLRDRIIRTWQSELNARRGAGGKVRESLHQVEVVELQHRRSRALDPHIHRHLWLNVKVLGRDGQWSNVDSRVAMRLHTLINAEGDLAARTDPQWLAALARHGYTVDAQGEIAELVRAVRPLSRRSNQIEANRAELLLEWRGRHPGQEPDHDILQQVDRLAWARRRPNKPGSVDERAWEHLIRDEIAAIDVKLLAARGPVSTLATVIADLDRDFLAIRAVVDADSRSTACGGRFSTYDIRAGATRAIAASGVCAPRENLQELIDDVAERAMTSVADLLPEELAKPEHVKAFIARDTVRLKTELAAAFERISRAGARLAEDDVRAVAHAILPSDQELDAGQLEAACVIAGSDRLVSVTGPAGSGKTTMLRTARVALLRQRRQLVVVAPTKKAASVAAREIGTTALSLHGLLADYGWRWRRDDAGQEVWTRLRVGDVDPQTRESYRGPRRFTLGPRDRIVVDEAGMVDLHTARALADLADETGAGIAMVGDHLQAAPVGHAGAMACMTRRATAVVELTAVHRFRDEEYAALSLRLREPARDVEAMEVAVELGERGLIRRVADAAQAREVMVEGYFRWSAERHRVALVTSTNEDADLVNEAIQERRIRMGQLNPMRVAIGQGEQRLLEGDVVQTRLNDRLAGVENRALWTVRSITPTDVELVALADGADIRRVSRGYAAEHVHLAYASTVHGIQGETTDASIVGPGVDASGLYVGMTRGRLRNEVVAVAWTDEDARARVAECMMRGQQEVTLDDSRAAAGSELRRAARDIEPMERVAPVDGRSSGWLTELEAEQRDLEAARRDSRRLEVVRRDAASRGHGRSDVVRADDAGRSVAGDVAHMRGRVSEYERAVLDYERSLRDLDDVNGGVHAIHVVDPRPKPEADPYAARGWHGPERSSQGLGR